MITTHDEATDWLAEHVPYEPVVLGLDCETTELDTYDPEWRLRLIQLSYQGNVLLLDPAGDWSKFFSLPNLSFATHTDIDAEFIEAGLGIRIIDKIRDTHLMARVYNKTDQNGLKYLSQELLGRTDLIEAEEALNARFKELAPKGVRGVNKVKTWGFANIDVADPVYLEYAGLDAVVVEELFHFLNAKLGDSELLAREEWLGRQMYIARRRGIKLDVDLAQSFWTTFDDHYQHAGSEIERMTDLPADSLYIAEWLDEQGVSFNGKYMTKTGRPSLNREHLKWLADQLEVVVPDKAKELVHLKLERSEYKNLRTVVNGFLSNQRAGRLHPTIKTMEARTGRMSVTNPPLQTLKKDDKRLRGMLMADPGMVLISSDFSQVEIRVAAALSKDTTLCRGVLAGLDAHDATAMEVWGEDFTPAQRKLAKTLNFGAIYGGGPKALASQAGIGLAEARQIHKQWKETYPGLIAYGERLGSMREVRNPFGRRLRIDPERGYAALNYMIQSTARDILVERMQSMEEFMPYFWMVVHDELIFQVPESDAEVAREIVEERMATTLDGIPITAEAEILGVRWGSED